MSDIIYFIKYINLPTIYKISILIDKQSFEFSKNEQKNYNYN